MSSASVERDLAGRIKELSKALAADASDSAISIMEDLKKNISPTEDQLRVGS